LTADPGSFRDPDSQLHVDDQGRVLRALTPRAVERWDAVEPSAALRELVETGRIVRSTRLGAGALPGAAEVLEHERIPAITYPYEWSFSMLRDAALLELDVLRRLLDDGLILSDGTLYNVAFRGPRPVFIDVGSLRPADSGEPWAGYRQFCMQALFPLMLQAFRGVSPRPWLRGAIEGITPAEVRALLRGRDLLRRGVPGHVVLHARLERREARRRPGEVRKELAKAGFSAEIVKANADRLRRLVARLRWSPPASPWDGYHEAGVYDDAAHERKQAFVSEVAATRRWTMAWDVGCHDGRYSRIVAPHAGSVIAFDTDEPTVDRLYRELRDEDVENVLPLVHDLADPSPGLGWGLRERRPLADRARPDLVLMLAVIHHLAIGRSIPLPALLDWLRDLGATAVVEFPHPEDPMAASLIGRKDPGTHDAYTLEAFEAEVARRFTVERRELLPGGTRTLYLVTPT